MKNKKYTIIPALAAVVFITAAATSNTPDPVKYTNLKVLPKHISSHDLQSIMADDFEESKLLGFSRMILKMN